MDQKALDKLRSTPRENLSKATKKFLEENATANSRLKDTEAQIHRLNIIREQLVGICDYTMMKALESSQAQGTEYLKEPLGHEYAKAAKAGGRMTP